MKNTPTSAEDVKAKNVGVHPGLERKPVCRSLGPHLVGACPPHADPNSPESLLDGVNKRMGQQLPVPKVNRKKFLRKMMLFVDRWCKDNLSPLQCESDWSFEEWLKQTNYQEWRKDELRKYNEEVDYLLKRDKHGDLAHFIVKLFMKDEHYVDYKYPRGIYARDEAAKIVFGPWFKLIENELYKNPSFIKHVPVRDRPAYITDKLFFDGATYIATDYTAYEAHFTSDLMLACEFRLYEYMLQYIPGSGEILNLMREVLAGTNRIYNKFVKATVEGRRMSGEMNTSLGNGFSNLMFMSFVCDCKGLKANGVVEGDDGLFSFVGEAPTTQDFLDLGFNIKLEKFDQLSKASFCGLLFDEEAKRVVTCPRKVLGLFGWTTARYLRANRNKKLMLLRCKALSLAYQYPGCPIIGSLAQYGLRVTKSMDISGFIERRRDLDLYSYEKLKQAKENEKISRLYEKPHIGSRLLFEELYGIDIQEQLRIEEYFDSLDVITPLDPPCFAEECPSSWKHYFDNYCMPFEKSDSCGDYITLPSTNLR